MTFTIRRILAVTFLVAILIRPLTLLYKSFFGQTFINTVLTHLQLIGWILIGSEYPTQSVDFVNASGIEGMAIAVGSILTYGVIFCIIVIIAYIINEFIKKGKI